MDKVHIKQLAISSGKCKAEFVDQLCEDCHALGHCELFRQSVALPLYSESAPQVPVEVPAKVVVEEPQIRTAYELFRLSGNYHHREVIGWYWTKEQADLELAQQVSSSYRSSWRVSSIYVILLAGRWRRLLARSYPIQGKQPFDNNAGSGE